MTECFQFCHNNIFRFICVVFLFKIFFFEGVCAILWLINYFAVAFVDGF